jgi:hypothetical protein
VGVLSPDATFWDARAGKVIIPLLALLAKALASPAHDRQFDRRSSLAWPVRSNRESGASWRIRGADLRTIDGQRFVKPMWPVSRALKVLGALNGESDPWRGEDRRIECAS